MKTLFLKLLQSSCLVISLLCQSQLSAKINETVFKDYYGLLEKSVGDSTVNIISVLKNFLQSHPHFEQVYLKLLEQYLYQNRMPEARNYFFKLTESKVYERNSNWMLAKIYAIMDEPNNARNYYNSIFLTSSVSPTLLNEYVEFLHYNSKTIDGIEEIRKLNFGYNNNNIALGFFKHTNLNFKGALNFLNLLPKSDSKNEQVLFILGNCYFRLLDFSQAESLWITGLKLSKENRNLQAEAQFLNGLGLLKKRAHKYDEALKYFELANNIAKRTQDLLSLQRSTGNIGFLEYRRAPKKAVTEFNKAIDISTKINAQTYTALWYYGKALAFYELEKFDEAISMCEKGEKLALRTNSLTKLIEIKTLLGEIYANLQQNSIAKKILWEAYVQAKEMNMIVYQHRTESRLANIMVAEKDFEGAIKIYKSIINSQRDKVDLDFKAYWTWCLAEAFKLNGMYDLAKKEFEQAYGIAEKAQSKYYMAWSLLRLADVEVVNDNCEKAIQMYLDKLICKVATDDLELLGEQQFGLGNSYKKKENLDAAISAYTKAVEVIEKTRANLKVEQLRIGYFSKVNEVYRNLVNCFFQRFENTGAVSDLDSLIFYKEMSWARSLRDLRLKPSSNNSTNFDSLKYEEYLDACKQLRLIQRDMRLNPSRIDSLNSQHETSRYALIAKRLRLIEDEKFTHENKVSISLVVSNILNKLNKSDFGLLRYHISKEASFVIVATRDELKVVRLQTNPNLLDSLIKTLMTPFHEIKEESAGNIIFNADIAYQLHEILVRPVKEAIALPNKLFIVPESILCNLPFELLLVSKPESEEFKPSDAPTYADKFLVNRCTVVYSPSISFIQDSYNTRLANPNILVFANPSGNYNFSKAHQKVASMRTGWRFEPLPFAELEAERIQKVYPQTQLQLRKNATKGILKKSIQEYEILHFASHAFVDTTFDAFSGLVLATSSDSTDDGMLMGYEIADLNLNCDLVTLSACETGRGKLVAGEGVLGMPRIFLGAGAASVVMTQWKVDDKFASELMPNFYRYYLKKGFSKAEALSKAKRDILINIKKEGDVHYQHPFYWASFTLFGDPGQDHGQTSWFKIVSISILFLALLTILVQYLKRRTFVT